MTESHDSEPEASLLSGVHDWLLKIPIDSVVERIVESSTRRSMDFRVISIKQG